MRSQRTHHARRSASLALTVGIALAAFVGLSPADAVAQSSVSEDLERYWAGSREMPVIGGNKLYVTEGRLELGVFGGVLPNDDFFTYFPIGANIGYSFDGIWGIELSGAYTGLTADAELTSFLEDNGADIRKEVDLGDKQLARIDAVATFSPLYGKWSFQTYKISHFDLYVILGAGLVITDEPEFVGGNLDPEPEPVLGFHPEGVIGAGFRFFLLDYMSLKIDARGYIYPRFDDSVGSPAQITLGLSFLTPEL